MDATHWFCWITAAGTVLGILAAVQQLLQHGMRPLLRAVLVTLVVGVAAALMYPCIEVRTVGSGIQLLLAVDGTPAPTAPANGAGRRPTPPGPAPTPVEGTPTEPAPRSGTAPDTSPLHANGKRGDLAALELGLVGARPVSPVAVSPVSPAPGVGDHAAAKLATESAGHVGAAGFKPPQPVFLPAEQKYFLPAEVAYCPLCSMAYSSQGPNFAVKCPHCGGTVDLAPDKDYVVHRCGKCGTLYRTTHFPPPIGPYIFRYYCPVCQEYHWFPN